MMTHMEMAQAGREASLHVPYRDTFICTGCHKPIALFNRGGELVALEVHRPYAYTASSVQIGWGVSGFGMWQETRARSCHWGRD